jgi:DNA anti-recombination protein RmuC
MELSSLQKRLGAFSELFEKIGAHLKNVQQSYQEADRRLDKTQAALDGMLDAGDAPADLPEAQQALPLPAVSSAKSGS